MAEEKSHFFPLLILPVIWEPITWRAKAGGIYILLYLRPFHSFCGYAGPDRDHGQKRRTDCYGKQRGKSKTGNDRNPWLSAGLDSVLRFVHVLSSYRNSASQV